MTPSAAVGLTDLFVTIVKHAIAPSLSYIVFVYLVMVIKYKMLMWYFSVSSQEEAF